MDRDKNNVEAILPLTSQQAGLYLFGAGDGGDDPGFLQVGFDLIGMLDLARWRAAWEAVLERHEALRMTVQPRKGKESLSVIWKRLELPWQCEDLSGLDADAQIARLEDYRAKRYAAGLDLSDGPVMLLTTFDLGGGKHRVEWTCHHLFLDGWSASIVISDALTLYGQRSLPPATSYVDYRRLRDKCDRLEEERHWRNELSQDLQPLMLAGGRRLNRVRATVERVLSAEEIESIESFCLREKVPAASLLRGAWAAVLSCLAGREDVVFGSIASGRADTFPEVESLAGFLSNTLPVDCRIAVGQSAASWLRELRDHQMRGAPFESVPLETALGSAGIHRVPFDHLLLIENMPKIAAYGDELSVENYVSGITSTYPFTIAVIPSGTWQFSVDYDSGAFERGWVTELLESLCEMLGAIARRGDDASITDLLDGFTMPMLPIEKKVELDAGTQHAGPRSKAELEMVEWWSEILDISGIGIHDDFFELGGRSLQALRLFRRIEAEMGTVHPPTLLLANSTVAKLAAAIGDQTADADFKCLVPITIKGGGPAVYAVHAAGGHILHYKEFAEAMGMSARVYGIQPVGIHGDEPPQKTVQSMAERYVEEMLRSGESGPFHLLGYCYGAGVALEMARRLIDLRHEVGLVVLVDAAAPIRYLDRLKAMSAPQRFHEWLRRARERGGTAVAKSLVARLGKLAVWIQPDEPTALSRVQDACKAAYLDYQPEQLHYPVVFLKGTDNNGDYGRGEDGGAIADWREFAPELEVVHMPYKHDDFFNSDSSKAIAQFLTEQLKKSNQS